MTQTRTGNAHASASSPRRVLFGCPLARTIVPCAMRERIGGEATDRKRRGCRCAQRVKGGREGTKRERRRPPPDVRPPTCRLVLPITLSPYHPITHVYAARERAPAYC